MTPIKAPIKSNENGIYNIVGGKRKRRQPKVIVGDLLKTIILCEYVSKADTTNWGYNKCTSTKKIIDNTIPS